MAETRFHFVDPRGQKWWGGDVEVSRPKPVRTAKDAHGKRGYYCPLCGLRAEIDSDDKVKLLYFNEEQTLKCKSCRGRLKSLKALAACQEKERIHDLRWKNHMKVSRFSAARRRY